MMARYRAMVSLAGPAAIAAALLAGCGPRGGGTAIRTAQVGTGPLEVWTEYEGTLEARRIEPVMSRFAGGATIIELAEEGRAVRQGDQVVRFDATEVAQDLRKAEHARAGAASELEALEQATLPIERADLAAQVLDARAAWESELQFLDDSRPLVGQGLVSEAEIRQQEAKVATLAARRAQAESRMLLTTGSLHRARLEKARSALEDASRQRDFAAAQLSNAVVCAPCEGMVVYMPVQVGTEYRTVRVGDTVHMNQPFLAIPDMRALVADFRIPESDLGRVAVGACAGVSPVAFPDLVLTGRVDAVGAMAQSQPGAADAGRSFHVVVAIPEGDPRLRAGMTVRIRVLAFRLAEALLVPRTAIDWSGGRPVCEVETASGPERRDVKLGPGDAQRFQVLEGLKPGDRVRLP